jgi:hypothetical protein
MENTVRYVRSKGNISPLSNNDERHTPYLTLEDSDNTYNISSFFNQEKNERRNEDQNSALSIYNK